MLLLLFFCCFASRDLIRDSQDNISKRAAVEKKPLTLWKDKEKQNIIAEQANIPKFSKLDDIGTLSDFESFFDDALVDIVFG